MSRTEHTSRAPSVIAICVVIAMIATVFGAASAPLADAQAPTIEQVNDDLGMGLNLGNALEAQREGELGLTLRSDYFTTIAEAGFGHVRVPIRFDAYTSDSAPFTIPDGIDAGVPNADNLWDRVDWVIANAEDNGLYVILDLHMFYELSEDVAGERDRFLAIWQQISTRYADASQFVLFELLNEPHGQFNDDAALLNSVLADALTVVRSTNPTRPVLVGPAYWNGIGALQALELPVDPNLIVSVHFYDPFDFTHQGATWINPTPPAPTGFDRDLVSFGGGWGDWSWGTIAVPRADSMRVDFERQWAALSFGRPSLVTPASLKVVASGASELSVRCSIADDENTEVTRITPTQVASTFEIDMTVCTDLTRSLNFMLVSPTPATVTFFEIELCETGGRCTRLIESGEQAINTRFEEAAAWGQANGRPIHVGEFGAYSAEGVADLADRAAWTGIVRSAGRSRGFSMSYWEFGSGFGVYDPITEMWIEPLLTALGLEVPLRGDVTCDSVFDIGDAMAVAQYAVGLRAAVDGCSLDSAASQLNALRADFDRNGTIDIGDALVMAQCTVGVDSLGICP